MFEASKEIPGARSYRCLCVEGERFRCECAEESCQKNLRGGVECGTCNTCANIYCREHLEDHVTLCRLAG